MRDETEMFVLESRYRMDALTCFTTTLLPWLLRMLLHSTRSARHQPMAPRPCVAHICKSRSHSSRLHSPSFSFLFAVTLFGINTSNVDPSSMLILPRASNESPAAIQLTIDSILERMASDIPHHHLRLTSRHPIRALHF